MIVAVIGKGGVGKTTVTALLLRRLREAGETPVLAVDADPSNCLGPVLGLSVDHTLAEVRDDLRNGTSSSSPPSPGSFGGTGGGAGATASTRPPSMAKSEWLALQAEDTIVEQPGYDLLTMGHSEGPGCYCFVNNLIRNHLDRLARGYRHVLVDCEAGLEHLSRRTSGRPDRLVCVANGSRMSIETVSRALALYKQLNGTLPKVDLVLNLSAHGATSVPASASLAIEGFASVIPVPWDPAIADLDGAARSLLDIDPASPAVKALDAWTL